MRKKYTESQQDKIREITNGFIYGGGRLVSVGGACFGVGGRRSTWRKIQGEFKIIKKIGNDKDCLVVNRIWRNA